MAGSYHGTAELVDRQGRVVDRVAVSLYARRPAAVSLGSWGGQIRALEVNQSDWYEAEVIRLKDGSEARIVVEHETTVDSNGGPLRSGSLIGSGPAPF
jgi:hypothetical protein